MSLNHKRRIFSPQATRKRSSPLVRALAIGCGATTVVLVASMFIHSSNAPAFSRLDSRLTARAGDLVVVDGDTLRLGEQVVRLDGIAAPERNTVCRENGADVDCATAAANALAGLLRGGGVDCAIRGHDKYGRPVAACQASGQSLSMGMVTDGWARARSDGLRPAEDAARAARRGIWQNGS